MPQPSFLQVILEEPDGRRSGAEIRNTANFATASKLLAGDVYPLARLGRESPTRAPRSPTVAALDARRIAALHETIAARQPRVVIFEGVALLDALAATRRAFPGLGLVLDCHNVESAVEAAVRRARWPAALRWLVPFIQRGALARSRAADREAMELVDAVWFCSPDDLAAARRLGPVPRAHVIPNPIPPWVAAARSACTAPGDEVLFVGHLGYHPNRRAVHELCAAILPRLRRLRPDTRLHVCGRSPAPALARLVEAAGGRLTADPPDLGDAYRRAAVVAVPLREGGGTRIKIIEALAIGRPIVATAKAVEGLGLAPGTHYVRAETPREFATALARLLDDPDGARALAARGGEVVEARFGSQAREAAYSEALKPFGARSP